MTLIPFPTNMLSGFVKKSALYLPPEHRTNILNAVNSKQKPNALLEKAKIVVLCILSAKQHQNEEEFEKDIKEALSSITLTTSELALFDGLLGGKQGMLIEFAKKGVSKERMNKIRINLPQP